MTGQVLSIGLDLLVLIVLGATIYYALRLSRSLNSFRQYRAEFSSLMQELNRSIDKAHSAIAELKASSNVENSDAMRAIEESRQLADELHLMNEAGNALASRLEELAVKGRKALEHSREASEPSFHIQDRDFTLEEDALFPDEEDQEIDTMAEEEYRKPYADYMYAEEPSRPREFKSQAERELFEALQRTGRASRRKS